MVYCTCILPLSVVRWMSFDEEAKRGVTSVPPAWTFTVITIFGLSGFLNVILVLTTKRNLFGRRKKPSSGSPSAINTDSEYEMGSLANPSR